MVLSSSHLSTWVTTQSLLRRKAMMLLNILLILTAILSTARPVFQWRTYKSRRSIVRMSSWRSGFVMQRIILHLREQRLMLLSQAMRDHRSQLEDSLWTPTDGSTYQLKGMVPISMMCHMMDLPPHKRRLLLTWLP